MPLVLASASPRRRDLLGLLGIPFTVVAADVDERAVASPAEAKALAVARPGDVVIGADTEIDLDGERIGKPHDAIDAAAILGRFAGRGHEVVTEVAIVDAAGRVRRFAVRSGVTMRPRDDTAIHAYVATGEPADKAGAYAIQGGGRDLIEQHDGCRANIIGLPLCHLAGALRDAGMAAPEPAAEACQRALAFDCPVWQRASAQGRRLSDQSAFRS